MSEHHEMSKNENIAGCVALPFLMAWHGFVASTLWGWYLVPLFGLPTISVLVAIGLRATVAMWTPMSMSKNTRPMSELISLSFFYPLMLLVIGYVVKP